MVKKTCYFEIPQYSFPYGSLDEIIDFIKEKASGLPPNAEDVKWCLESENDYGSALAVLRASYKRDENPSERKERLAFERRREEYERLQFEKLREKFETKKEK